MSSNKFSPAWPVIAGQWVAHDHEWDEWTTSYFEGMEADPFQTRLCEGCQAVTFDDAYWELVGR